MDATKRLARRGRMKCHVQQRNVRRKRQRPNASLARTPALWPSTVVILQPVSFPILFNGRVAGQALAKAGTSLRVLRVYDEQVEIEFQNARQVIPAGYTDLMQRSLLKFKNGDS